MSEPTWRRVNELLIVAALVSLAVIAAAMAPVSTVLLGFAIGVGVYGIRRGR